MRKATIGVAIVLCFAFGALPVEARCPNGTNNVGGVCTPKSQIPKAVSIRCPNGFNKVDGVCVAKALLPTPKFTRCPNGTNRYNGVCTDKTLIPTKAPKAK